MSLVTFISKQDGFEMRTPTISPPRILTIAGSDSGGGAGVQGDLKTIAAHGCYGMSVITAITAQNTMGVSAVSDVAPEMVVAQLEATVNDIGVDAAKMGMLSRPETIVAISDYIRFRPLPRLVLDPVMVSKGGHRLLQPEAVRALKLQLFPFATLITPNLPEVGELLGVVPGTVAEMESAARELGEMTPGAVLVKGGHGGSETIVDVLWDGSAVHHFTSKRLSATHTHGTGCTLSASIACHLGMGFSIVESVSRARAYLLAAMEAAYPLGRGIGPVNHLWAMSGFGPHNQQTPMEDS